MIGIDLVDLTDPLLKPRDHRTLQLITHPLDQYDPQDHIFWLLWTAKESIFKCRRKIEPFDPKSIPIKIQKSETSFRFQSEDISGHFIIEVNRILAVCSLDNTPFNYSIWKRVKINPSEDVRERALLLLNANANQLITKDENDLPCLSESLLPLSFTHHGKYCGLAYPIT